METSSLRPSLACSHLYRSSRKGPKFRLIFSLLYDININNLFSQLRSRSKVPKTEPQALHVAKTSVTHLDTDKLQERCMSHPNWAAVFLPTLTQLLYTSHKPFDDFHVQCDEFLDMAQQAFDSAFPLVQCRLQFNDNLVKTVSTFIPQVVNLVIQYLFLGMQVNEKSEIMHCS